jgi:heme oxygenase
MSATERLREDTRGLHESVEAATDLEGRCATLEGYRDLLERTASYLAAIEPVLAGFAWDELGVDIAQRQRLALVARDLAVLGSDAPPAAQGVFTPRSLAEAIGALYVLEGSTLGGRFIERKVAALLGLDATSGIAYFHGHGERTGAMWKDFKQRADAWCGDDESRYTVALHGARETFASFGRVLAA